MTRRYTPSLRTKFLLAVLIGAVLPMAVFGLWLMGTAERSAEVLLRSRLDNSLGQIVDDVSLRWVAHRSDLLDLAEHSSVQHALMGASGSESPVVEPPVQELNSRYALIQDDFPSVFIRNLDGGAVFSWEAEPALASQLGASGSPLLPVSVPVYMTGTSTRLGVVEAQLRLSTLFSETATWEGVAGSVLAASHPETGVPLNQTPFEPSLLRQDRFVYADEQWIDEKVALHEIPLQLSIAAPLGPFIEPFSEAAHQNLLLLVLVALFGLMLAAVMSWPVTRAMASLVSAAERVAQGSLEEKVEDSRSDEVGRLARAFNAMTESLQNTLHRLSQREALASVGEFASGLAHEVRNPLTSIRVDLQRAEEKLPAESEALALIQDVLQQVERVDRSVTGALRVARSGQVDREIVDLRQPLAAAVHQAEPSFQTSGGSLVPLELGPDPLWISGSSAALEQLFLNLLLNAAEAMKDGGHAGVEVESRDGEARVSVWDDGPGIPPEAVERVFDPFFSTKPRGTGLGLAIAKRIAAAHGSELRLESSSMAGARLSLAFPLVEGAGGT